MMEIVIKIDENVFTRLFDNGTEDYEIANDDLFAIAKAIRKGTPLPEHHGLIDRLELSDHIKNRLIQTAMNNMETILPYSEVCTDIVDNRIDTWIDEVKTIIEADKGVLEKINEKQDSLKATCKAWDEAIEKDEYVD